MRKVVLTALAVLAFVAFTFSGCKKQPPVAPKKAPTQATPEKKPAAPPTPVAPEKQAAPAPAPSTTEKPAAPAPTTPPPTKAP